MAERRMFTQKIIDSDAFLDMPLSAQALYFHLAMRADDDGFVNNPKKILRYIGAADDDLRLLLAKRFILSFDSGVIVIKHWRMHNLIKKDRYHPTDYQEELSELDVTKIRHLTLRGPIDANDLGLIRAREGRLTTLEMLDLKDVTLVPKDRVYYNSWTRAVDMTFTGYLNCICIGENGRTETVVPEGVPSQGGGYWVYNYYDDLAYAFKDMPFKRVVWPKSIKKIGEGAFQNSDIEILEMSENPQVIGKDAFNNCAELRELPSLSSVTHMGASAFGDCKRLAVLDDKREIDLSSLDSIPSYAFDDCTSIKSFVLSPNLKQIDGDAFGGCASLISVTLPESLTDIPYGAFKDTPWYNNLEWVDNIKYINKVAMESKYEATALNFREGTIAIADGFYHNQYSVSQVNRPSSVRYIGSSAFTGLQCTTVKLPSSLKKIGAGAFAGAFAESKLTSVELPESLEEIGENAFSRLSGSCPK